VLVAAIGIGATAPAEETPIIAVATNLSHPLAEISDRFAAENGIRVRLSFGSSGNFTNQIRQGAPYELFLSADRKFVDVLAADGLTAGEPSAFAAGRIGALIPEGSSLSAATDLKSLINLMINGSYRRIAMANPKFAPFGVAAEEALQSAGVWAIERDRVALAENAAQAVQFTLSGNVDVGIIPYSFALLPEVGGKGRFFLFPPEWHKPLSQWRVLLKGAGDAARRFHEYLGGGPARDVLEKFGYTVPESQ
ncbi:MAG: molybdate ABC transporter substrate-binding protein, partial [Gammaproteobacteria bacterium]